MIIPTLQEFFFLFDLMWKIISNVTLSWLVVRHSSSLYFTGQRPCICSPLSPSKEFINRSIFQCNFNIIIQICSIVICLERKINHTQAPCSDSRVCMDPLFIRVCTAWNQKPEKLRGHGVSHRKLPCRVRIKCSHWIYRVTCWTECPLLVKM